LAHTGLSYEEIGERTVPQVESILARIGRHICLKAGVPVGDGDGGSAESEKEHTVEDGMAFAALFSGIC
jgi:hypothetical protein